MRSINMMLYAHPGEGKTPFWGTEPRLLLMDADDGYESAIASGSKCDRMPVHDYADLDEAYQYMKIESSKSPSKRAYDWCVLDSLTIFQERSLIDDLTADAHMMNPNQSPDVPGKREYGIDHNRICRYVRQFVALPIHFGISCHVMIESDPNDGSTLWVPSVQGKNMFSKVSGYMNVIGLLSHVPVLDKDKKPTGKSVPRILFRRQGKFYARDRFGVLGLHMDNPTVPKITEAISPSLSNGQDEEAAPAPPRRRRRRASSGT